MTEFMNKAILYITCFAINVILILPKLEFDAQLFDHLKMIHPPIERRRIPISVHRAGSDHNSPLSPYCSRHLF